MRELLRRIRGAIGMGLTWALGWTFVGMLGVVFFYTLFPNVPDVFDVWIPVFAYPGFLAGVGFSVVLRIAEGRRRFDELSLSRFTALGAAGGFLVGTLVAAIGLGNVPIAALATITGTTTILGAGSASGILVLARQADGRGSLDSGPEVAEVGRGELEG